MVCLQFLVQLNSDLLCVSHLSVCTAGTANRLGLGTYTCHCVALHTICHFVQVFMLMLKIFIQHS